jgi:RNA polymerase sigma-70 factor (sigma-E family)
MSDRDEFAAFVESSCRGLLRSAWLLAGDWPPAEDLVQSALAATWRRWREVGPVEYPEAYVRRVMITTYMRWNKRRRRGEIAVARLPDHAAREDAYARVEAHEAVRSALAVLPPKQRAVIVLRYFADLTEAQTAAAMNCAIGTVKSQSAKALARLHDVPGLADVLTEGRAS